VLGEAEIEAVKNEKVVPEEDFDSGRGRYTQTHTHIYIYVYKGAYLGPAIS
jgi:hypothetical protein